jgi:Tannase and feruloyl esterase
MTRRVRFALCSTVSLMALAAGGTRAWADTACTGSMTGDIAGNVVVPVGASCTLYQANVGGNVRVSQKASLTVDGLEEQSSISGNVQADQCQATLLEGSVTVGGNVQIQHCTGTSGFAGPGIKIRGNFQCLDNSGECEATLGEVGGNLQVDNNRSVTASDVSLNVIGGNLECQGNTAAPTHALGGGWVTGNLQGQCAAHLGFSAAPYSCASLAKLSLPDTTILLAQVYQAGATIEEYSGGAPTTTTTPAPVSLCRVVGNIMPSTNPAHDSNINFEAWLPISDWTGRYEQVGNGGAAGSIEYSSLQGAIANYNAAASTDDGSSQPAGNPPEFFALGHLQRVNDYGYRAVHRTNLDAQLIATAFYGTPPGRAYFNGCSKGGQEAFMEVHRYPYDFDGVLAGAPGINSVVLMGQQVYNPQQVTNPYNPGGFIPPASLTAVTQAVQTYCANAKTVPTDNFLGNPKLCSPDPRTGFFNPQPILAPLVASGQLTSAQATALSNVYAGIVTDLDVPPFNLGPGPEPGNEAQEWPGNITQATGTTLITPPTTSDYRAGNGWYTEMLQQPDANSLLSFTVTPGPESPDALHNLPIVPPSPGSAEQTVGSATDAFNPNLAAFEAHGGKVIEYHGWADPEVASNYSVVHYDAVVAYEGGNLADTQRHYRLFMAPGMAHCSGGPGLNSFGNLTALTSPPTAGGSGPASSDIFTALETWVEQGIEPRQVIATDVPNATTVGTFSRPLCPYPQNATYTGRGSTADAASFICR